MIAAHATAVKTWGVSCQTSEESVIKKKQVIQSDIWIHAEDTKAASKQAKQGEKKSKFTIVKSMLAVAPLVKTAELVRATAAAA